MKIIIKQDELRKVRKAFAPKEQVIKNKKIYNRKLKHKNSK